MFDPLKSASASPTEEASKKKRFVAFYEDVLAESQRFGTVTRMEVRFLIIVAISGLASYGTRFAADSSKRIPPPCRQCVY